MPKAKSEKAIIGACGEYFVSAYLSGHHLLVALPRAGVKVSDLFVAHPDSGFPLRIQVKTGTDSKRKYKGEWCYEWQMAMPAGKYCNESTWYAFVWLNNWPKSPGTPEIFFIPSVDVRSRMNDDRKDGEPSWSSFWIKAVHTADFQDGTGLDRMIQAMTAPKASSGNAVPLS